MLPLLVLACSQAQSSRPADAQAAPDRLLSGYWEVQDTRTLEDENLPYRLRFFVNANNMEEVQFCTLGGRHGFSTWSNAQGPRHFRLVQNVADNQFLDGTVTRLEGENLELNGKYEYHRMAVPGGQAEALATDATNSLCTL